MKIKIILLIALILCSFLVIAQEGEEEILDLGGLLGIGENITASGIDYSVEETSQRKDTLINFNEEDSFLKIGNNTFENIQPSSEKRNAFVKLDESGKIIKADFMTNENGGTYNFLGEDIFVPANSRVTFTESEGLIIDATEGSEFSQSDNLFDLKLIGKNIKLPNGEILNSGELSYDATGQAFLEKGKIATVNNVEISTKGDLPVYFDGSEHEGNYLSFGEKGIKGESVSATNDYKIKFEKDNPYAKIDEGDVFNIHVLKGEFELTNKELGKIPSLNCGGFINVIQDSKILKNTDRAKSFYLDIEKMSTVTFGSDDPVDPLSTTSPMKISFFDQEGDAVINSGISSEKNNVLFVDNANRFAIAPEGKEEFYSEVEGIETGFSSRLSYNYVKEEDLEILTGGKIKFEGNIPQNQKDLTYQRFRDYWNNLNGDYKENINEVIIGSPEYFEKEGHEFAKGFAERTGKLYLRAGDAGEEFDYDLVRHEAAHLYHFQIEGENFYKVKDLYDEYDYYKEKEEYFKSQLNSFEEGSKNYETIQDQLNIMKELKEEKYQIYLSEREKLEANNEFDSKWKEIAGEIPTVGYTKSRGFHYEDDMGDYARDGLIRAYGGRQFHEDIATYVEKIKYPEVFSELINPSSDQYDIRYRQKIDLLHEYSFISDEEYYNILEAAGVK